MGKPAVPLRHKLLALCAACLMASGFAPFAFADDMQDDSVAASFMGAEGEESGEAATPNSILASTLTAGGVSIVSADVALGSDASEPVVGSFTVGGLTFAINEGGATLVSVDPSVILSGDAERSGASPFREGEAGVEGSLSIPQTITYAGTTYPVTAVGPYAFYLSGATQVSLPATIASVNERAFRSSDVESVSVAADNPNIASFDGALYSADKSSLLLIPEGRAGAVLLPCETEVVEPSLFSHCSLVDAISVEEGGAAFASWDGLLYDASGATLLRVPAGAVDITIREGCTTIAAGAMEGCAKLERINAPSTVTSISPNVFESVPTISLPASTLSSEGATPQLNAMIALTTRTQEASPIEVSSIRVILAPGDKNTEWKNAGLSTEVTEGLVANLESFDAYAATVGTIYVKLNGHAVYRQSYFCSNSGATSSNNTTSVVSSDQSVAFERRCGSNSGANTTIWCDYRLVSSTSWWSYSWGPSATPGWTLIGWSANTNSASNLVSGNPRWDTSVTVYAQWRANTYTVSFNANGGSGGQSANVTATYDSAMPTISKTKPTRAGYTFGGWYDTNAASGGTQYYTTACASARTWNKTGNTTLYARWTANTITCTWDSQGGSSVSNTSATYAATTKVPIPADEPTRLGYAFAGWWTAASGGTQATSSTVLPTSNPTYYAHWSIIPYTISYDLNKGSAPDNPGAYNVETATFTLKNPTRQGYVFTGWSGTDLEGDDNMEVVIPQGSVGNREYAAHWAPAISADMPLEVTARVDMVGIEEQTEASGYVESLCGEPLKVVDADFEPLSGAEALFGTDTGSVSLVGFPGTSTTPLFTFALDTEGAESNAGALSPLTMESYGTRIPIRYRFDIPDELLPTLTETTLPVCQVSYTVALA